MSYSFETMLRLIPILIGLAGAAKVVYEMVGAPRGRQREEYRFAMEFLRAIKEDPLMHPFLRETGYQAVAGTRVLSADEVEYLLSLQRPDRAIREKNKVSDYNLTDQIVV